MPNALNEKYEPILGTTRYYIVTGGRGSGKSFAVTSILGGLTFEPMQRILFTRYTMTSAHISIIPEFIEKIELMNANHCFEITKTEITNTKTGGQILFRGIKTSSGNQTANLKSLQGITTWVVDEAEELTDEATFDKIDLSVRQQGVVNRVILILNPTTKDHWIYRRFFEQAGVPEGSNTTKGDTTYIHTTYLDNIDNLDPSFINQVERIRATNPGKYQHVVLGGWINQAEGVIFPNWTEGAFDNTLPYCYGQDYGFSIDPTTLARVAVDSKLKRICVHEEFYDKHRQLSTSDIFEINKSRLLQPRDLIVADSAEPRLISELKNRGLNIEPCVKKPGSVSASISKMQEYEIIVTPESTNIKRELNNYVWNDKRAGVPIDAHNHMIDNIRYAFDRLTNKRPALGLM
jgi:phage terminase large subunit